jgi:hypothetical protein
MNNLLSFSSVRLDRFTKDGTRLKPSSGFVLEADNRYYLITNLHVLSGMDKESSLEPYFLKTFIHSHWGEGEKRFPFSMGRRQRITVPLYDDTSAPTWRECQARGASEPPADIAALPLQLSSLSTSLLALRPFKGERLPDISGGNYWSKVSAIPISAIDTDVDYDPPDPVHVIGYPHSWAPEGTDRSSSAFWRTSFIASEIYEAGMSRSDVFFIDPCAPEGMTGSPVAGMKNDRMKLLGVYSDRSTAEFGANAGLVYGARLLKELIGHRNE